MQPFHMMDYMRVGRGDLAWEEWRWGSDSWMGIGISGKILNSSLFLKNCQKMKCCSRKKNAKLAHECGWPRTIFSLFVSRHSIACLVKYCITNKYIWFFNLSWFNNSFTLDLPLLSTPRGWQINLQLIRPVALRSIDFWSGVTDGEWDM